MKSLSIFILLFVTVCSIAQEKTITGTVVDEANMPLPGATIVIKGTTTGTSTDFDGKYSISANKGDVLSLSYIGYNNQDVVIGDSSTVDVSLELNSLEEVVVTTLGIKRKPDALTSSTKTVKAEVLTQAANPNVVQSLAGKVSGLKINTTSNYSRSIKGKKLSNSKVIRVKKGVSQNTNTYITLRGNRSLTGSNQALIVIDGAISPANTLANLAPEIIESTNIIKGAGGSALYGSQGSNGVIVVTTKSGTKIQNKKLDSFLKNYKKPIVDNEVYEVIKENNFERAHLSPLSTFSIEVDKASYANTRRMINNGQKVNPEAVKLEEFINYFEYNYPQPSDAHPFSITTEVNTTPWNKQTKLVRIGLQGKTIEQSEFPASNLVFLIDVSGSMSGANKLGLLKKAFKFLTNELRAKDKVSIVVYAGAAGVVLEPTSGSKKQKIMDALDKLKSGGSTAGGKGIELAYKIAQENFIKNGNNRIILATDGDFNVGASSNKEMEKLIVEKRKSGVYLTCLGFGYGNYKDSKLETLADKGNGNHGYIDNMQEAQKMFGKEFGGTLYTIAKDVKIQVEFNPNIVEGYRLIGYENRLLNDEDFVDDTKDAGELGSGHTVTALYEIALKGTVCDYLKEIPKLKYTKTDLSNSTSKELFTVKFRYKKPNSNKSIEIIKIAENNNTDYISEDFNFSSAVALFGMQLRGSKYTNNTNYNDVILLAKKGRGKDKDGYRAEFIRLIKTLQ